MISAIKLKKCVAAASIFSVVVSKFHHRKKSCPIILLEIDKGLEIGFHRIILPLCLAVRLRVESNGESPLNTKEIT